MFAAAPREEDLDGQWSWHAGCAAAESHHTHCPHPRPGLY